MIKLPCFQCVNVLVHTTEHQMKIYLSIQPHLKWPQQMQSHLPVDTCLDRCTIFFWLAPQQNQQLVQDHGGTHLPSTANHPVMSDQWSVWDCEAQAWSYCLYPQTHLQHIESNRNSGTILVQTDKFDKCEKTSCFHSSHYIFLFSRIQTYINQVKLQDS